MHTMVGSPEFWRHCGENRTQFLDKAVWKVCGHGGGGGDHWCRHYANVGHHQWLRDLIEFAPAALVVRFFEHYRNRTPISLEVDHWKDRFSNGRLDDLLVEVLMLDYPKFVSPVDNGA